MTPHILTRSLDRSATIFILIVAAAGILLPLSNLLLPAGSALQATTYALLLGFFRNDFGFGGNNGLTDFKDILGFNVQADGTRAALLALSCLALIIGFLICRAVVTSKLGKVLIAVRDAESRTRFLGYRVESYKLFVFTLSACMAGVAGALYVPQVGIINPSEFAPGNSIEAVICVAVGGR